MHSLYNFVSGPLAWASFIVFFGGLIGRLIWMIWLAKTKDPVIGGYLSLKFGLRSILAWSVPFLARNWRMNPAMTVATFVFHICLFLAPIFLMGHLAMLDGTFSLSWPTLPDGIADIMAMLVIACCIFFFARRLSTPEARYVSRPKEFLIVVLVCLPFLTGVLAYHQIFDPLFMLTLHIASAELLLVLVPFTWLSHILLGPMIRAYAGSEFGSVRHTKDW
jgi:nitrate reductase gamma subunit